MEDLHRPQCNGHHTFVSHRAETGTQQGMQTMGKALADLSRTLDRDAFRRLLQGGLY